MKRIPFTMCGLLMLMPLTAASVYAQSTTAPSGSTAGKSTQTTAAPAKAAPSPRSTAVAGLPVDPNAPAPPAHPITAAQTGELLNLMEFKKMEDQGWTQLISNNKQRAPFIPQAVWTDVQTGLSGIDYVPVIQPVYAKYLSTEDAAKALEFYRTAAGKRVLQAMPAILGESVAATQAKGQQVGRDAIEKHRTEIEAAQKKYQEEHAPAGGGPTLGPGAGAPPSGGPATGPSSNPSSTPKGSSTTPASPSSTPPPPQH